MFDWYEMRIRQKKDIRVRIRYLLAAVTDEHITTEEFKALVGMVLPELKEELCG